MRVTPWPEGCTVAPILWQDPLGETYSTIHDVPTSVLANQRELALVLLLDRRKRKILFQVPNTKVNWRYHFGCQLLELQNPRQQQDDDEGQNEESNKVPESLTNILHSHGIYPIPNPSSSSSMIRKAGTMLFTFPPTGEQQDPMRVHVFEAEVNSSSSSSDNSVEKGHDEDDEGRIGGCWYDFDSIPYTKMWADDILWLPWFVAPENNEYGLIKFEGHFIFDGNPGPDTLLVAHNCQRIK